MTDERFLAMAAAIAKQDTRLSPLAAGVLASLFLGIADDSRSFARIFGIAHALVLREISVMEDGRTPITIISRNPKTRRTRLALNQDGIALATVAATSLDPV